MIMQRKFVSPLFWLMSALLVLSLSTASSSRLAAEESPVIIRFQSNQKSLLSSSFCARLLALPEWEPFFDAFTKACDKGFEREKQRILDKLPKDVSSDIQRNSDKDLTTRRLIEGFAKHVDAIVFELRADLDRVDIDENLKDIFDILRGKTKDIELDFDGVLAVLIDADPRDALPLLKYLRENKDYKFLRNEPGGDFIIDFDFDFHDREIEFCMAGIQLPQKSGENKRYALLFSNDDEIASLCESFKTGRHSQLDLSTPRKELALEETCFLFIEQQRQRFGLNSSGTEFFSKIKRLSTSFNDQDGAAQFELSVVMRSQEDAAALRDLLKGMLALAQLGQPENSSLIKWIQSIKIDAENANVAVAVKLDNPELWKELASGLTKATEKIEQKLQDQ